MPATKRPPSTSAPPPPKRRPLPSKWNHHPQCTEHLLNLCIRRADTRNRLGTETASRGFSENEWRHITAHLNTRFTTRFEWTQCRSKFLELRGLWEVWLALYQKVVDKRAPNTWKGGRRIRGRWVSRAGDTPKNTVELGEVYFEAFEGVEKVGHERLKEQYGRLVRLFGEDLAFGRYAYFVDEVSLTGSEGEDGGDAEEMGSCEEDGEDVEEGSVGEDDGEIVEESTRSERDGDDLGGNPDIEDDGVDLEESSSREGDGKAHKQQSMARVGTAIGAQRTATGRLSRSRKAIAARREEKWCEEIKKLTAAVLEEPKSTITTAIERCKPLLAVQQLTPDDQDDLFQALAQSTNADIIVELPKEDLVWYAEELLLEVKQSPRAALNRCSKLAAFKELQPSDRNLLYAAVMQPPRAKTIAALSDTDLAAFLEELLVSLKQAAAAKSCSVAGFPEDRRGRDPALAPVPLYQQHAPHQQHSPHQQLPPNQQQLPHPAHQQYQQHPQQPPRPLHQQHPQQPPLQQPQQHPPHQPYTPHPNGVYAHHQRPEEYQGGPLQRLQQAPSPPLVPGASTNQSSSTAPPHHPYQQYQPSCSDSDRAARKRQSVTHLASSASACASADARARQEVRSCHSPEAVAARDQDRTNNPVHELPMAVKDPASGPRTTTTVSAALARCEMLAAVRELSPEDRVKLYTVVAQPPMPDLIIALPYRDLAPYVETLVNWAKQAPQEAILPPASRGGGSKSDLSGTGRVAVTRCSSLAAVRALSRGDHVLLITAVGQPPHSGLVAALSDADLVEYTKALLNSLKQAPAARESFAGGPPEIQLKGGSTATAAAVPAAAIAPIPEGRAGVDTAILPLARAMAQGERPSLSLLGYGWTAQPWARELTDYLWGQFYKDMACGTVGTGSLSAPAVEAGAVSWRAA
ncbi:hypothetical protein LTR02_008264 [Friedmanniomyces endolithicus]|nr:hypothetical protein LTR75_014723 [Friedmanniomyces endolithicus]KAK0802813.1 hypothetical protein LTR59_004915 [Friedmanniomyces endolithicus]KAK0813625.1 hypothetical protein LTR38_002974 [Friedmanniomyces endolithicus]KAK0852131.1 hypothetical protein LTR03_003633 [Friedmanniomyces endolithicus]KAK0902187.1 hypothetical protein LTR02_008264 [Friedmanniomyces endolithicus]